MKTIEKARCYKYKYTPHVELQNLISILISIFSTNDINIIDVV